MPRSLSIELISRQIQKKLAVKLYLIVKWAPPAFPLQMILQVKKLMAPKEWWGMP